MNQDRQRSLSEARKSTLATHSEGDAAKWQAYKTLVTYEARLAWRLKEGHAEVCRLQRLSFHGFI